VAGAQSQNQGVKEGALKFEDAQGRLGDSQTPGLDRHDVRNGGRSFREEPWVAKLPPELRNAIRSNSQRRPPKAYEERLRRYFESVE
jgi:hypothetical protein